MNVDEAIALLLGGQPCAGCGAAAEAPGQPCGQCGALPPVTSAELAETLDAAPLAVAEIEAGQALAEGWQLLDRAIDRLHDADRCRQVARLRLRRDETQQAFDAHHREHSRLHGPRTSARKALDKAAAELATAQAEHAEIALAEETARRYRHGVRAETEAAVRLREASAVLARYQAAQADAAARLQAAEAAVSQSAAQGSRLEADRDAAVEALRNPQIGYGMETISAGLMRLLVGGRLDEVEQVLAGQLARWACSVTGVTADIEAQACARLLAEQEAEARSKRHWLRPAGDGTGRLAVPNPGHPATPTPAVPWAGAGGW